MITPSREGVMQSNAIRYRLYARPVKNRAVIREDERGSASGLLQYHVSEIADPVVRQRIMNLSVLEIIS